MAESLFSKYGGFVAVGKLVHEFYKKVLDEPELVHYFKDVPMQKLMEHQTNFLSRAMAGPDKYEGRDLVLAHKQFGISDKEFSLVVDCLEETLDEAGMDEGDITAIMTVIAETKKQIVSEGVK